MKRRRLAFRRRSLILFPRPIAGRSVAGESLGMRLALLALASWFVVGCSSAGVPAHSPRLQPDEVAALARRAGVRDGYVLKDYNQLAPRFEFVYRDHTWTVFFEGKRPAPGNHFSVWVDDQTRKTTVMPGE